MPSLFDLPFEDQPAGPEPDAPPATPGTEDAPARRDREVYTVTDLAAAIRGRLERDFFEIWVEGEISNCKRWSSTGHVYFTLKDDRAQLKAVIFRSSLRFLRFQPEDGQHVVARGRVTVYEPRGECQLVCEHLEPKGLGARQLAFEQLKRRLEAEGLFAPARKRTLPLLPQTIGIVTSLDGAAIKDIIKVVTRRHAGLRLIVCPCRVQGDGAAAEIAQAIRRLVRLGSIDVIIVGRGGGSIEDLWAFNDEIVARAIAACPIPIVSGVGHETDFTIADFVADVRAATPSNAAEIVVARKDELRRQITHLARRLAAGLRDRVARGRAAVHGHATRRGLVTVRTRVANRGRQVAELGHALRASMRTRLDRSARHVRDLDRRLDAADQRRRLAQLGTRLGAAEARLGSGLRAALHRREVRLGSLAGRLENLSPLTVLARGYAVAFAGDGRTILRDAAHVRPGDDIRVRLERGALDCRVRTTHPETDR
jgi:exodeoxyribonuclease VII large subunit